MDEPTLPTAEDLGVSQEEYAKILRDLRQRGLGGESVAFAAEMSRSAVPDTPEGLYDSPAADAPRKQPLARWWVITVIAALVVAFIGWRGSSSSESGSKNDYVFLQEANGQ